MIRGSCLCGEVRYEIRGTLSPVTHCHCSQCRKAHGAAFGSYARVDAADFRWLSGEASVAFFRSSPDVRRSFCRNCGTRLQFLRDSRPQSFSIAVATLDGDPGTRPMHHIFVGSKAPWFEIAGDLPQYEERPPSK